MTGARASAADPTRAGQTASQAAATRPGPPRLALSVGEACESLGVSWDFWREHVEPELRVVRRGRRKLVAVAELGRWLDRSADAPLATGIGSLTAPKSPANRGVRASRAPVR